MTNKRLFTIALVLLFSPFIAESKSSFSLPEVIRAPGEKLVLVDPRIHAWGAYTEDGYLVRSGTASTGKSWCSDIQRPCRTKTGVFRIYHLGDEDCYSTRFPIPTGGAPMPYCMYFNGNQALHGSYEVGKAHLSHGCVRMHVSDARWLRYEFVTQGTLVVIRPY